MLSLTISTYLIDSSVIVNHIVGSVLNIITSIVTITHMKEVTGHCSNIGYIGKGCFWHRRA